MNIGGIVWYGPPNATGLWQPVDSGYGNLLKVLTKAEQQDWLEHDENLERWMGNSAHKFTAKERRVLIAHWVGAAFEKLQVSNYDYARYRCFGRAGCLITADGSADGKIKPEGLPDYIVPPSLTLPAREEAAVCEVPDTEPPPFDQISPEDIDLEVEETTDDLGVDLAEDLGVDLAEERDYEHNLVRYNIRAFYEVGRWYIGKVTWYNRKLEKVRIYYDEDETDDNINGIDITLDIGHWTLDIGHW